MQDILAACLSLPGCCLSFYSDCVGINYVHKVCRLIFYIHSSTQTKCQSDEYTFHVWFMHVLSLCTVEF